ncbi:MAG TPA: electron transfer flavoprotein-ubiquinone oxidoreductase [Candidatus Polarisedimenticolia bacterium]|nr:electron transfer flavoprotein-ubiquinone oxidoreductase [Candidatus Polarisedimenticolia bacterium]
MPEPQREELEVDVLFVGGGPAGLAGAIRLRQLLAAHNETAKAAGKAPLELSIALIDKGREIGSHALSGAVIDPKGIRELIPDFLEAGFPVEAPVTDDAVWMLTRRHRFALPIVPPPLRNHGNYVASLGKVVRWLATRAEAAGVDLFPGFAAAEPLLDGERLVGVRTGDRGIAKSGQRKANYEPGIDIKAKVTVLCEGPRGTLTKVLVSRLGLDTGRHPQVYAIGIKEIWECPPGRIAPGRVIHTMGWPLDHATFGGGFIYHMAGNLLDIGLCVGLDYRNPEVDPFRAFQEFKTHPRLRAMLDGARLVSYGAKTIPEGGWYAMPRPYLAGGLIAGDSASMLNPMRLKGIHTAIKSGMLAAETTFEALLAGDTSAPFLSRYEERFRASWAGEELRRVRNFHAGFKHGLFPGLINSAIQMATGGRGLVDPMHQEAGHTRLRRLSDFGGAAAAASAAGADGFRTDGKLTFDRLTDVFHSGTRHDEDQPAHLKVADTSICETRCVEEFGNPCERFCPAAVYEMVAKEGGGKTLRINASNCVHCKTCDIMDPYQLIDWVPPEGGGGPQYEGM